MLLFFTTHSTEASFFLTASSLLFKKQVMRTYTTIITPIYILKKYYIYIQAFLTMHFQCSLKPAIYIYVY